jgi:hypothetical protein
MLEGYRIHFKAAFTHLIRVEEVVAGKETLLLPSFAEARLGGDRWVPASRWVNLGRLGPLPAEAGLPPYVILLARFEPVR